MTAERSPFEFRETLVFRGSLKNQYAEYAVRDLVVSRYRHRHPTEASFSFQFQQGDRDHAIAYFARNRAVEFVGELEFRDRGMLLRPPPARLLLRRTHTSTRSIEGIVERMDLAAEPLAFEPTQQTVTIWLTPTHVARRSYEVMIRYRSGELFERDFDTAAEPFEVPTDFCTLELSQGAHYEPVEIEGEPARLDIPFVALHGEVNTNCLSKDVPALIDGLSAQLQPLESVLSLFSRRHVRIHKYSVYSLGADAQTMSCETVRHVNGYSTPSPEYPLVSAQSLSRESIALTVSRLQQSPYRVPIEKALTFLLAFWQSRYIEQQVTASFTAFETLVNGIAAIDGSADTVPPEMFRPLSARVKETIKLFGKEQGLSSPVRARLYEKVGELQRVALGSSAESILQRYAVEWRDIWSLESAADAQGLRREIVRAYGLRSGLLHAGDTGPISALMIDAAAIHALAERLVCKLLQVPDDWLDHTAYSYAERRFRW